MTKGTPVITVTQLTTEQATDLLPALIPLLQDVVDAGASIGFLPPLSSAEAAAYWQKVIAELPDGHRLLFGAWVDGVLVGSAQLALESRRNGDHRGEVQKVMVHPNQRRRGIGRALMMAVEAAARQAERTLLVLDTRQGDAGELLYRRLGYVQAGIIPHYARNGDGGFDNTVLYYRLLV
jgi:acetyltransferase